jgi:hypothetical protein
MKVYSERTKFGLNWMQILIVAVAANLLGGFVFTLTEGLVPSWVVYPILLIIGLWILHRRAITGALFLLGSAALFLLIHLPFTLLVGLRGSQCPDCSPTLLWVTLFIVPLLTTFVAMIAWQQARHQDRKQA